MLAILSLPQKREEGEEIIPGKEMGEVKHRADQDAAEDAGVSEIVQ